MFDIGWTEIIVVVIVACIMLEVKDLPKVFKSIRQLINYCNSLIKEVKQAFQDTIEETTKITDLEGKEHKTYDLEDIMPDIIREDGKRRSRKHPKKPD